MFLGVRRGSGELIAIDEATKKIEHNRAARRAQEKQLWGTENLAWVRAVPWSTGGDDSETDGEMPEFDFEHGPGTRLTAGEMEEIKSQEQQKIINKALLKRMDFEKCGFSDRCGGCSAIAWG